MMIDAMWRVQLETFFLDVPAALLEMGFMTNDNDAAAMVSETKRRKLVNGVVGAIDQFFENQTRLVAAR